jgi:heme oxygenase (biliverdin-IX-beta and delta-forming)
LRARLKTATNEVHERMHAHPGFAGAAAGTISAEAYRNLLARLYGFHAAFEARMGTAPEAFAKAIELPARSRAELIVEDLLALGAARETIDTLPRCDDIPLLSGEADRLGALYVVEGSTLGGAFIAKALERSAADARRFFRGHRGDQGRLWRNLVKALDQLDDIPAEADDAERAALSTFAAFERWMADWEGAYAKAENQAIA